MNLSLDLEHFISVIPIAPGHATPEQLAEIRTIRDELAAIIGQPIKLHLFGERLTDTVREDGSPPPGVAK